MEKLREKIKKVMEKYKQDFPDVKVDKDYYPFKVTEEWGECLQTYLMLSDRGRQKGKSKEEIKKDFADELADVFGFLILFADSQEIDIEKAIEDKWFKHLK